MQPGEAEALGHLGGQLIAGVAGWAEELHLAVAARAFGYLGGVGAPARAVHDVVAARAYSTVRAFGDAAGQVGGAVLAPLAGGSSLVDSPAGGQLVALLDGLLGDRLHDQQSPLALPMALRSGGKDVAADRAALELAFPDATGRLVLFVHGLAETDLAWVGRDEAGRPWSYAHAVEPIGWSGAAVRYNTGRHIAASGASLASLIEEVVGAWPVPVTDLALVGHSMGGLVIRAACASAAVAEQQWPALVRSCVYLGSPHHGATLEQGVNIFGRLLGRVAEAGPVASLLRSRSAGIRDLRYGLLTAEDDTDIDELLTGTPTDVALLPTSRHHLVAAHLGTSDHSPAALLLGDLFVRPGSALGLGSRRAVALDSGERTTFPATNHFGLLKDPRVAEALVEWLS